MRTVNLSTGNCTYIIITGATLVELEGNVNDIISQGWNADGFVGGPQRDDSGGYFQAIIICPGEAAKAASEIKVK